MKKETSNSISKKVKACLFLLPLLLLFNIASAKENVGGSGGHRNGGGGNVMATGCIAGSTQQEILLNNVRTRILTDGDMWWDFTANVAKYEIPKGSNSYAQFAGSLWFGGYTNGNILHTACMTYRQNGIDFWPGPLNPSNLSEDIATCQAFDKVWTFNRADVANFYAYWNQYGTADPNTPLWIKDYPGNTSYPGYTVSIPAPTVGSSLSANLPSPISPMNYMAPYVDVNSDGVYNYASGDYPAYHLQTTIPVKRGECVRYLFGDQTLFFVFNDQGSNGNTHGETGGKSIGVEIRGQAFEFATNDQLNDMTFYNYEIINWSPNTLDKTYITIWDDCDLGNYQDDMVGCDVSRGLGYQYNGENYDGDVGGQTGYHDKLPAIGCDFFQGPYADTSDGIDNDRDGCIDCSWSQCANGSYTCQPAIPDYNLPEQCIMSRFTYFNNTSDPEIGNPDYRKDFQYYNYMSGVWKNGVPMSYGNSGTTAGGIPCTFLFPGITDPLGWGLGYHPNGYRFTSSPGTPVQPPGGTGAFGASGWTQYQGGLPMNDMRFLMSAGVFTMLPGAVNYVTYGIPFARSTQANYLAPIPLLYAADDKAQSLFDNCFKVLDGPDAPTLTIQELNKQLLFTITNNPYTSNNYEARRYADFDPSIILPNNPTSDNIYRFQGYIVYQLADNSVSVTDLANPNLARKVFQCDIKDGVKQLINYIPDPTLGLVPTLMVNGADAGIQNSFSISQDLFSSTSDNNLVNFKNYYFMAVAYAYNNYLTYVPNVPPTTQANGTSVDPKSGDYNGQQKPFLQGRNNVQVYTGIPHDPSPEAYGTVMNSSFGNGPPVTRIEGQGNGGYVLDLMDQSVSDILNPANNSRVQQITYVPGAAPVNVKVIDPLRIVKGSFTVKLVTANSQPNGSGISWYYNGNPPIAGPNTLDTGRVKNIPATKWVMTGTYHDINGNSVTKTWLSDEGLSVAQEKIITGLNNESLGFSVTMQQCSDPNMTAKFTGNSCYAYQGAATAADLLQSTLTFAGTPWLTGVQNQDVNPNQNWILSGNNANSIQGGINVNACNGFKQAEVLFGDPNKIWEGVLNGTWAPFAMVNNLPIFPGYNGSSLSGPIAHTSPIASGTNWGDNRLLSSVDIVFTSNDANWTRCPVIDMNMAINPQTYVTNPSTGIPYKWQLRSAPSVDKHGRNKYAAGCNLADATLTADSSMGWFPGYAINVETGERLNIIFAENSADSGSTGNNGNDMIWNPTSTLVNVAGNQVNGGMHYVYICGHNSDGNFTVGSEVIPSDVRRYDAGQSVYQMLSGKVSSAGAPLWPVNYGAIPTSKTNEKANKWALLAEVFKDIMWCGMPLSSANIKDPHNIPGDAKIRIRVPKPFRYGLSTVTAPANTSYSISSTSSFSVSETHTVTAINSNLVANLPYDVVSHPQNGNFPMYTFNTNSLAASTYQSGTAKNSLAKINIVPNPYYAHSAYEHNRIDLEVKIINLPVNCTIKIYSLAGTLVRTITKDNSDTYVVWNLNNSSNIQIASGLYIIHIDAPGIGERILKWFGVLRPYDLQSF
jgi:hypothetical protein